MAARTPVTKGTAGYCPPGSIYLSHANASPDPLGQTPVRLARTAGLRHQRWYFSDVDTAELWTTPPAGVVAIAFQIKADFGGTPTAITMNAARQALAGTASNIPMWVHTWSRGSKSRSTGTNVPPVRKGTSGFVHPDNCLLMSDHDTGGSDPLSTGRFSGRAQALRHQAFYFDDFDSSDTWDVAYPESSVDWAWQPVAAADNGFFTLDHTDGFTNFGDANCNGWLHVWRS